MERRVEWNFGVTCRGDELRRLSSEKSLPCLCWKIRFGIENLEISVNKNIFNSRRDDRGRRWVFCSWVRSEYDVWNVTLQCLQTKVP